MKELIEPNIPKFKKVKQMPEMLMAMIISMWERELGNIPKYNDRRMFTYFDSIYTNHKISEDYYIHEMAHFVRQGNGENEVLAKTWWDSYCKSKEFRYQEELIAYREQYKYMKTKLNKPQLFEYGRYLAAELSSEKYGNLCDNLHALHAIIAP